MSPVDLSEATKSIASLYRAEAPRMIEISPIEVLALKKLVLINHALGQALSDPLANREQRSLTEVLAEIATRADIANKTGGKP